MTAGDQENMRNIGHWVSLVGSLFPTKGSLLIRNQVAVVGLVLQLISFLIFVSLTIVFGYRL